MENNTSGLPNNYSIAERMLSGLGGKEKLKGGSVAKEKMTV